MSRPRLVPKEPGAESSRLKVLHLDHSNAKGGAEFALLRILNADPGWAAVVVVPGVHEDPGVWDGLQPSANTSLVRLGSPHRAGASQSHGVHGLFKFAKQICSQALALRRSPHFEEADVIHANTTRAALYGTLASLGTRHQIVVHLRDMTNVEGLGRLGYIAMSRFILPRASAVIGNSRSTLGTAAPYISKRTISAIIPSAFGFDGGLETVTEPTALRHVGMVARIDPWKGQDLLIRAFAKVFRGQDVRLSFAGSPEFEHAEYLQQLRALTVALDIQSQVDFLGHVADINGYLRGLDICVQASLRPEPLGQNVLQYLAAGKAVIAADEGGPTEWIHHGVNGLLFSSREEGSLVRALDSLRDSRLRNKLAAAASCTSGLRSDHDIARAHENMFQAIARPRRTS